MLSLTKVSVAELKHGKDYLVRVLGNVFVSPLKSFPAYGAKLFFDDVKARFVIATEECDEIYLIEQKD